MVSDVLAGRRSVRDVFQTREFNEALGTNLGKIEEGIDQLTEEERAEVFDPARPRTSQAKLDALRGDPGPDETGRRRGRRAGPEDSVLLSRIKQARLLVFCPAGMLAGMSAAIRIATVRVLRGPVAAVREMLTDGPLDVLTGDYLAELTMLILGRTG